MQYNLSLGSGALLIVEKENTQVYLKEHIRSFIGIPKCKKTKVCLKGYDGVELDDLYLRLRPKSEMPVVFVDGSKFDIRVQQDAGVGMRKECFLLVNNKEEFHELCDLLQIGEDNE